MTIPVEKDRDCPHNTLNRISIYCPVTLCRDWLINEMRSATGPSYVTQFETPKQSLSGLSAEANAALLSAVSDVVLVIDGEGVVQDVSTSNGALPVAGSQHNWIG